jgi:uridine phosphorylase
MEGDRRQEKIMESNQYPILEFDPAPEAIIEPSRIIARQPDLPRYAVLCFFYDIIADLVKSGEAVEIDHLVSELGHNPIYRMEWKGQKYLLIHPGVGGPIAAAFLEELIARGVDKFIACGGAGVLQPEITVGHLVIPVSAVRDEGTSYHYLAPSREVEASPAAVAAIEATLKEQKVPYLLGKTWTTDAFYRETIGRTSLRKQEGCITVEMESATFFAVSKFRGVTFGQILYGGDSVKAEGWDSRDWVTRGDIRRDLVRLSADACLRL